MRYAAVCASSVRLGSKVPVPGQGLQVRKRPQTNYYFRDWKYPGSPGMGCFLPGCSAVYMGRNLIQYRGPWASSAQGRSPAPVTSHLSRPVLPTGYICILRRSAVPHTGSGSFCFRAAMWQHPRLTSGYWPRPVQPEGCKGHLRSFCAGLR